MYSERLLNILARLGRLLATVVRNRSPDRNPPARCCIQRSEIHILRALQKKQRDSGLMFRTNSSYTRNTNKRVRASQALHFSVLTRTPIHQKEEPQSSLSTERRASILSIFTHDTSRFTRLQMRSRFMLQFPPMFHLQDKTTRLLLQN
jgi:hypothetical protein